jgi:hypothetical protein
VTCEKLRPDYLLYAIGTLGEPESSELRAHLARGCAVCTEGLHQAHAVAYSMGSVVEGPETPRELRERVLGISGTPGIEAVPARRPAWFWSAPASRWRGWALAAAGIVWPSWNGRMVAGTSRGACTGGGTPRAHGSGRSFGGIGA